MEQINITYIVSSRARWNLFNSNWFYTSDAYYNHIESRDAISISHEILDKRYGNIEY